MPAHDQIRPTRGLLLLILAAHLLVLALAADGGLDGLSFDTRFQAERPSTLDVFVEGLRGALEGRGFYDVGHLSAFVGSFDPMASRATPATIALVGAPFAFVPEPWRTPLWFLLNELILLGVAVLILRHVPRRGTALAFVAAWAVGLPYFVTLGTGAPVAIAAAALLAAALAEGRAGAAGFGLLALLRPFFTGILIHAALARRWPFVAAAAGALLVTALLFALHPADLSIFLGRHPYGQSYPGNLGLQAFLFSALRNSLPDHTIAIPIAGRVIYDLNILSLILQRLLALALVAGAVLLSLRARRPAQIGAVAALWACTWIATGVEVREADFLLVIAGAAAMSRRAGTGWVLPLAALWLALPTPFGLLPLEGIESWSPEFGWTAAQTLAQHGWKLIPAGAVYALAARACYRDEEGAGARV